MTRPYRQRKASFAERFGLIFGGGTIAAALSAQVVFVVWLAAL